MNILLLLSATFGIIGSIIGILIGKFAPYMYTRLIEVGAKEGFTAVQVGFWLGLPQGLVFGAIVGVAVAMMITWHDVKIAKLKYISRVSKT